MVCVVTSECMKVDKITHVEEGKGKSVIGAFTFVFSTFLLLRRFLMLPLDSSKKVICTMS